MVIKNKKSLFHNRRGELTFNDKLILYREYYSDYLRTFTNNQINGIAPVLDFSKEQSYLSFIQYFETIPVYEKIPLFNRGVLLNVKNE